MMRYILTLLTAACIAQTKPQFTHDGKHLLLPVGQVKPLYDATQTVRVLTRRNDTLFALAVRAVSNTSRVTDSLTASMARERAALNAAATLREQIGRAKESTAWYRKPGVTIPAGLLLGFVGGVYVVDRLKK